MRDKIINIVKKFFIIAKKFFLIFGGLAVVALALCLLSCVMYLGAITLLEFLLGLGMPNWGEPIVIVAAVVAFMSLGLAIADELNR